MLALNSFLWIRVLAGEVFCGFVNLCSGASEAR